MTTGPTKSRTWNSSFVLDDTKLVRICNVFEQRVGQHGGQVCFAFTATLKNGTAAKQLTIPHLVSLDNTTKNPVRTLLISAEHTGAGAVSARVEFNNRSEKNVSLDVSGSDPVAVSEVFATIEEQVERTLGSQWTQIAALLCALFILLGLLLILFRFEPSGSTLSLLGFNDLQELAKSSDTVTKEADQVAWLFDLNRRLVLAQKSRASVWTIDSFSWSNIARWSPFLIVIALLLYLAAHRSDNQQH